MTNTFTWLVGLVLLAITALHERGYRAEKAHGPLRNGAQREVWLARAGLVGAAAMLLSPLASLARGDLFLRSLVDAGLAWCCAPAIVLGAPWSFLATGLGRPLGASLAGERRNGARPVPVRARPRSIHPLGALAVVVVFWAFHLPVLADATVGSGGLRALEYACYLAGGVLTWLTLVGSYPVEARWQPLPRVALITAVLAGTWALGAAMVYAVAPWYHAFDQGANRFLPVVTSQQLSGAVMWGVPSVPLGIATMWAFAQWLRDDESGTELIARPSLRAPDSRPELHSRGEVGDAPARA